MQESLGGAENYKKAFLEKLDEVYASGEDLKLSPVSQPVSKSGMGSISDPRVLEQKQPGLYTVSWHPVGGQRIFLCCVLLVTHFGIWMMWKCVWRG